MVRFLVALLVIAMASTVRAETLKIGLVRQFRNAREVTVGATADLSIKNKSGDSVALVSCGDHIVLRTKDRQLEMTGADGVLTSVGREIRIASAAPDTLIMLNLSGTQPTRYRGSITAKLEDGGILLVNIIDLEDYLLGAVPSEVPPDYVPEALKAQSVAARTYACSHRGKHGKLGYDLCDTTDCQMYLGASAERSSTSEAVKSTANLVATYRGRLIQAVYSGDCGGVTQDGGQPYLACVTDRPASSDKDYCDRAGHCWSKTWKLDELEKLLQRACPDLKGLRSLSAAGVDTSGRVTIVDIQAEEGSAQMAAVKLRGLLGNTIIKSTNFTVKTEDGIVTFEGRGFGHGIGLCQSGANGLARDPYNYAYDKILKHYYTGVEIVPLSSVK